MDGGRDDVDLISCIFMLTRQIPEGMVSTYGDIARALGDVAASRAVGEVLSRNPRPIEVPCHRVVYGDGRVGWYMGKGRGTDVKEGLLSREGVAIREDRVLRFEEVRFRDFDTVPVLKHLRDEQERLKDRVVERDVDHDMVCGLDVSYSDDTAYGAMTSWEGSRMVDVAYTMMRTTFPYVPGYLTYRELPVIRRLMGRKEALYLIDGNGILHPRRFGLASHAGVVTGLPTVGVAKSLLIGEVDEEGQVIVDGEVRGRELRVGKGRIYVSVGHMVTLDTAVEVVRSYLRTSAPEPLRQAHLLANAYRRKG
jgi:deoxyribonuclease V